MREKATNLFRLPIGDASRLGPTKQWILGLTLCSLSVAMPPPFALAEELFSFLSPNQMTDMAGDQTSAAAMLRKEKTTAKLD